MRRRLPLALVLAATATACRPMPPPPPSGGFERAPILLVAVDGMEWNAVIPLLHAGRLPTLAGLVRDGSFGLLETRPGFKSPALWTSIATGKEVAKHGIRDFLKPGRPLRFYESGDRRTKAFWNMLSERGRSVATLGWFVTYPVEPIHGVMVAQANTAEALKETQLVKGGLLPGLDRQVHPHERQAEFLAIAAEAEREKENMMVERVRTPLDELKPHVREGLERCGWAFRADAIYRRIAARLLDEGAPDLTAVYFGSIDVVSHHFWWWAEPQGFAGRVLDKDRAKRWAAGLTPGTWKNRVVGHWLWPLLAPPDPPGAHDIVNRSYEQLDHALADLIGRLPTPHTVIVVSDHGYRPWGHADGPDALFVAAGANIRRGGGPAPEKLARADLPRLGSILDVTPTLLALLDLPLGADMDGRPLEAVLAPSGERPRPAPLPTWDTPEWLAARGVTASEEPADPERLEQLRALGYIE